MQELQIRRIEHDGGGSPTESRHQYGANPAGSGPMPPPKDYPGYMGNEQQDYGDGPGGFPQGGAGSMPSGAPFADPRPFAPIPKARPNYSKLGMSFMSPVPLERMDCLFFIRYHICIKLTTHSLTYNRLDQI